MCSEGTRTFARGESSLTISFFKYICMYVICLMMNWLKFPTLNGHMGTWLCWMVRYPYTLVVWIPLCLDPSDGVKGSFIEARWLEVGY